MAAELIESTDVIPVQSVCALIYGSPGIAKSSIAQTADSPLTMDFDRGAHRAFGRKRVMRFGSWQDVSEAWPELAKHQTIVIDTIGRLLDLLTADIVANNAKHGSVHAGLSLQGFGVLKARFAQWIAQLRLAGKDLVMIAHEKEDKDGDSRIVRPDIIGGSYTEIMKLTDLVGFLKVQNGKRVLDFNPTDSYVGKNAAGWKPIIVPELSTAPQFLAGLIADAKTKMGQVSAESAAIANQVERAREVIGTLESAQDFNDMIDEVQKDMAEPARTQVKHLVWEAAKAKPVSYDKSAKRFMDKQTQTQGAA